MFTFVRRLISYWIIVLLVPVCTLFLDTHTAPLSHTPSHEKLQQSASSADLLPNPFLIHPASPPVSTPLMVSKKSAPTVLSVSTPKRTPSIAVQRKRNEIPAKTATSPPASTTSTQKRTITASGQTPKQYAEKFRGNISAYTNGLSETGKTSRHPDYGITASGHRAKAGVTVAAGRHIPYGTVLYIEGIGYRTVHDRGGAIKGNKIDVFMSNMAQVNAFGRRHLDVYIVKWGDGKRKPR